MSRSSRLASGVYLACLAAAMMFVLASLGIALNRKDEGLAAVWLANAVIIALLLRHPRDQWPALLWGALAGNAGAGLLAGDGPALSLALSFSNLVEILLVTSLFARHFGPRDALDTVASVGRLAVLAFVGPLVATPLAGFALFAAGREVHLLSLAHWMAADMLGILILAPLLLTLSGSRPAAARGPRLEFGLLLGLALVAGLAVFSSDTSLIFLLTPVLVLAGLRLSLDRAALLVSLVCATGLLMTLAGLGPLALGELGSSSRAFLLQAFMATVVTLVLPVAALSQERARAAAARRLSEEQYRFLADHGSDLVLRLDLHGQALFVSSAARRMLGLDARALAGAAFSSRIHGEDLSRFIASLVRARRHGEAVACFRMRHARGAYRWIEAHVRLAGPEGNETTIVATLRDITQRRQAELRASHSAARLRETNRLLLMAEELASLGHGIYDPSFEEIVLSAEAATLLDLPQLTLRPTDALQLLVPEDRRDLLRCMALARRRDAPAECIVRLDREGRMRTLQLRIQQTGSHDRSPALFGVISDITDKLGAEQRLLEAWQEARRAAEFRSQFLATMSHEIRTPMTGVIGMIELLADEPPPAERKLYVDTLRQSADLLMAVLNDILDFSKVDGGHLTFTDEAFDLGKLLHDTVRLFDKAAAARGLTLALDAPPAGVAWLRGDALRLQQVLSNLLSNAIKFSDRGEVGVRCSLRPGSGGRQVLDLHVEDKGPGMSPAMQQQLFEPFVQGPAASGRGGTGLGLAISRRLVAGMGGSIVVCSAEGQGSTFAVKLTLAEAEAPHVDPPRRLPPATRPLDILVAEDNVVNQLLITALLKRMGHRITCASDGEAALECAGQRAFDLILMDMQMPRRDGLSTARAIRSGTGPNASTPIIALTADAAAERRSLYERGGIDAVLTKPIDSAALQAALATCTAGSRRPGSAPAMTLDPATLEEVRSVLGQAGLDQLLDLLADELSGRSHALRDALADCDFARAAAEAHSLKGAAANLGARAAAEAARLLELAIASAQDGDRSSLAPALRQLTQAVSETHHALAALPRAKPLALQA